MNPVPSNAVDGVAVGESFDGSLSIISLFMHADIIVKCVAMILVFASVWCWAIIFEKLRTLKSTKRRADNRTPYCSNGHAADAAGDGSIHGG